jgi:hypothetical protein
VVNLEQHDDAGITAQAIPKSAVAGGTAAFSLAVTAASPEPATVTDTPPACHPVSLTGIPLAQAKRIISALGCEVGKQTKKSSKKVAQGRCDLHNPEPRHGATQQQARDRRLNRQAAAQAPQEALSPS